MNLLALKYKFGGSEIIRDEFGSFKVIKDAFGGLPLYFLQKKNHIFDVTLD